MKTFEHSHKIKCDLSKINLEFQIKPCISPQPTQLLFKKILCMYFQNGSLPWNANFLSHINRGIPLFCSFFSYFWSQVCVIRIESINSWAFIHHYARGKILTPPARRFVHKLSRFVWRHRRSFSPFPFLLFSSPFFFFFYCRSNSLSE